MPDLDDEEMIYVKFKTYAEIMTDFLTNELNKVFNKDKCAHIFRDIDLYRDEFDKISR